MAMIVRDQLQIRHSALDAPKNQVVIGVTRVVPKATCSPIPGSKRIVYWSSGVVSDLELSNDAGKRVANGDAAVDVCPRFLFALRAKTSGYNGVVPPKVTPSTASKLWLNGQKMEVQSIDTNIAVKFWMTVACFFG